MQQVMVIEYQGYYIKLLSTYGYSIHDDRNSNSPVTTIIFKTNEKAKKYIDYLKGSTPALRNKFKACTGCLTPCDECVKAQSKE